MQKIKSNQLKPGMVLEAEIKNHSGRKLLPEGTRLTEKHILNLKAWGIVEAAVEGHGAGSESQLELEDFDPAKRLKAEKESQSLFRYANQDHPAVAEMMRLFIQNRLKG